MRSLLGQGPGVVPGTQGRGRGQRRRLRGCSSAGSASRSTSLSVSRRAYSRCQPCTALAPPPAPAPPPGAPAAQRPSSCSRASSSSSRTKIFFISRARAPSRRSTPSPAPRSMGAAAATGEPTGAPVASSPGRRGRVPGPAATSEYERASKMDQFVTRFLLRETVSQLQALQSSLEGASDTLEAQARGPRSDEHSVEVQSRSHGSRRAGRRALRSVGRSPTWSPGSFSSDTGQSSEAEMQWRLQVNRLQELIDQLECKAPRLEPLHEEEPTQGPESHILVAQRRVQVAEEAVQDFHRALCCYVDFTGAQSHCLQHQHSACSKAFQRILIDHLRAPDTLTTVFFPASWWIMNNN
ncbi:N-terminal EF-hand calcium-binding protein 3 isoform X3 [Meles meles]|uniref:N-terminal EF-hand calcium-binding protein 3 isoform X3 n=1 Tax=Meles meles TaxID=9662 RepID=UPI001E6A0553|nr:N-terminal EF-hand calcium-binding protein 3 isoform X3 [Meles meles]